MHILDKLHLLVDSKGDYKRGNNIFWRIIHHHPFAIKEINCTFAPPLRDSGTIQTYQI